MSTVEMEVRTNPVAEATRQVMELINSGKTVQERDVERIIFGCLSALHDYSLQHKDGVTDIRASHWAIKVMAESIADTLYELGGSNYVTCDIWTSKGPVVVTLQRKEGKSPAEIQDELIGMLRGLLDNGSGPEASEAAIDKACKWIYEYDVLTAEKNPKCQKAFRRPSRFKRFLFWLAAR